METDGRNGAQTGDHILCVKQIENAIIINTKINDNKNKIRFDINMSKSSQAKFQMKMHHAVREDLLRYLRSNIKSQEK